MVVIALARGVNTRLWRRPMQHAASPAFSRRSDWRMAIRIGPVVRPTFTRTRVIVPVPGTIMLSDALNSAPLVVKLHDGTRWNGTSAWQLAVLLAARKSRAPNDRAVSASAGAAAAISATTTAAASIERRAPMPIADHHIPVRRAGASSAGAPVRYSRRAFL